MENRPADIRIAVGLILNARGEMLMVRKHGSEVFMQPGGKMEDGETSLAALLREVEEEIGARLDADLFTAQGSAREWAANEPGQIVEADVFACFAEPDVSPQAEIAEARWISVSRPGETPRAALSAKHLFPIARHLLEERARDA